MESAQSEPTPKWGPSLTATIPIKVVANRKYSFAPKRDPMLQEALSTFHKTNDLLGIHYLDSHARSPILVDKQDPKEVVELLRKEDHFPLISSSLKNEIYTQTPGPKRSTRFTPLGFIQPNSHGSADENVGVVWAKKVLLSLHTGSKI